MTTVDLDRFAELCNQQMRLRKDLKRLTLRVTTDNRLYIFSGTSKIFLENAYNDRVYKKGRKIDFHYDTT